MSRRKCRHLKSPRSPTVSSAPRSHSGCVLHQGILSTRVPFVPWQSGLTFPRQKLTLLENSRSKVKVKGTPVSAASTWLISLVFHIGASYRLPPLPFHDNRASDSRDTIWPWKIKVTGHGQRSGSKVSLSIGPTIPIYGKQNFRLVKTDLKFYEK